MVVHPDVIECVMRHCEVVFTCKSCLFNKETNDGLVYNDQCDDNQVKEGFFISCMFAREEWKNMFLEKDKRGADIDPDALSCACVYSFGLAKCVCETFPISSLDTEELYQTALACVKGSQLGDTFDELPSSKKRWVLYNFYACNVYGIKAGRRLLPSCLMDTVRSHYPKEDCEEYTGFKPVFWACLLYTSPSPRDQRGSRMPSSA